MQKESISVKLIRDVLEVEDIDRIWLYLHETFKMNIPPWKERFRRELEIAPRFVNHQEAFMLFGKKKIEPLLNDLLKRSRYPTWVKLVTYVLRDKIETRRAIHDFYKDRYNKPV